MNTRTLPIVCLVLALVLASTPALGHGGHGTASGEELSSLDPLRVVNETVLPGSLGAHGSEVVFATPVDEEEIVEVWKVNTTSGEQDVLTAIPLPGEELSIDSLDYDGRYVAWADDRDGESLDVYVVNVQNRSLEAITDKPSDQRQVALDDGVLAWSSWGDFTVTALDLDTRQEYPVGQGAGVGPASAPDVHQDVVVWSKSVEGTNFEIFARNLSDGNLTRLTFDEMLQTTPKAWGELVIWAEGHLPNSMQEASNPDASEKPQGTQIALKDLRTNRTVHLTPGFGAFQDPVLSNGWAAWTIGDPEGFALYNFTENHVGVLRAPTGASPDLVLTEETVAFTIRGTDGVHVYADRPSHIVKLPSELGEEDSMWSGAVMGGLGGALIFSAVAIRYWRREEPAEDST